MLNGLPVKSIYRKSRDPVQVLSNFVGKVSHRHGMALPEVVFQVSKFESAAASLDSTSLRKRLLDAHVAKLTACEDPVMANMMCGKGKNGFKLFPDELKVWTELCVQRQDEICRRKFMEDPNVQKVLADSQGFYLVHLASRAKESDIWGGRVKDGKLIGQNKLGEAWMRLRDEMFGTIEHEHEHEHEHKHEHEHEHKHEHEHEHESKSQKLA
jgi:predicted NAD-dependent protein-ADP-ribosyltransferase YbiA (DUF1768 family)